MNPIPESEGGNLRLAPLNTVPLTQLMREASGEQDGADNEQPSPPTVTEPITDQRQERIVNAYRRLFRDAVDARILNQ